MIRPVRFAILALLILGVFAAGAALDWSASIRTEVPAIELQPAPAPLVTGRPVSPIRRTSPAKAKSADRKSRSATPDVRPVSPPEPARPSLRAANRSASPSAGGPRASTTTTTTTTTASTNAPRKAPTQPPTGGDDGGTTTTTATPPTETSAPETPTTGAAPVPAPPEPAGDDDDDEDEDDDGDDGGDDD
jgi:hypothetical protein